MTVTITLKGDPDSLEYMAGEKLRSLFEKEIGRKANGRILIRTNVTLIGTETKDIDIVVLGSFEWPKRLGMAVTSKLWDLETASISNEPFKQRMIQFNSFCFCIELKSHAPEVIVNDGTDILVPYRDKFSNATQQSEKQKTALRTFLENRVSNGFFVTNFLWLLNVNKKALIDLIGTAAISNHTHNILTSQVSVHDLLQLTVMQRPPITNERGTYYTAAPKEDASSIISKVDQAFDLFDQVKQHVGQLTRRQLELITRQLLDEQKYAQEIGSKLVIFSGRAGTGKTVKLLRLAFDLAFTEDKRCLVLTYNHALASDMRRIIHLSGMTDGADVRTVSVSTLDKFFYSLLSALELLGDNLLYIDRRDEYINELNEYLQSGAVTHDDIRRLSFSLLNWDYVLIDEGQDWKSPERDVIFRLFGSSHTIVAESPDQMIRGLARCNWAENVETYRPPPEKRCLRQKRNIAVFVNAFAKMVGLVWNLDPREDLVGGRVVIKVGDYSPELHIELYENCRNSGNLAYEMLMLVPPSLASPDPSAHTMVPTVGQIPNWYSSRENNVSLVKRFEGSGIKFWDGTKRDIRQEYPVDLEEHRLLQYDSCRGLEGWVVVCLNLDEFTNYKANVKHDTVEEIPSLGLFSPKEQAHDFALRWTLIPLTRAIDTLVITLVDDDSELAKTLRSLSERFPDFVEWRE